MTLYPDLLGDQFTILPKAVQDFHTPQGVTTWTGTSEITRGDNWFARLVCTLVGFPPAGSNVPLCLTITPDENGERWDRAFGPKVMSSRQRSTSRDLVEHLGPFRIHMRPEATSHALSMRPVAWRFLTLPLPKTLMPQSANAETEQDGKLNFNVEITAPLIGPLVTYTGFLEKQT